MLTDKVYGSISRVNLRKRSDGKEVIYVKKKKVNERKYGICQISLFSYMLLQNSCIRNYSSQRPGWRCPQRKRGIKKKEWKLFDRLVGGMPMKWENRKWKWARYKKGCFKYVPCGSIWNAGRHPYESTPKEKKMV